MKQSYQIFTAALLASMSLAAAAQARTVSDEQMLDALQAVQAQRSTAMQRYAGGRLQAIWNPQVKHSDVDWWLRSFGEWESYGDDAVSGKSRSVAVGMDMNTGKETRTGIYGMYNHTELNGGAAEALQQDWRIGAYMGKQHGAVQQYGYVNYGKLGNHYYGLINGDSVDNKYRGQIVELGGEYKYDLHHDDGKIYHVSPYVNVQASRYMQKSYCANAVPGVGKFVATAVNNNYLAGETGVELRRELQNGNYAVRLGYKRVLAGEEPELAHDFVNVLGASSPASVYSQNIDKDYLHLTLSGTLKLTKNLSATAEGAWLEGEHDRELKADVKLNWAF